MLRSTIHDCSQTGEFVTPSVDQNSSSPFLYELDSDVASVQSDVLEFTVHILVEAIEGNICAF